MSIRIAINGFGRIGRNVLRALSESGYSNKISIIAINEVEDIATSAHLLKYDTAHGCFEHTVTVVDQGILVNGERIIYLSESTPEELPWGSLDIDIVFECTGNLSESTPEELPWGSLDIDIVFECTGKFSASEKARAHLKSGAKKVLISAPSDNEVDATIVYGVNEASLKHEHKVVSNASCTTNCLAPLVKVLHETVGVESGLSTTIHAYTNDQRLTDTHHADLRLARAAGISIIPTKTHSAKAVGLVVPEVAGRIDGVAIRIPTLNVALVDFTFTASRLTDVAEINNAIQKASLGSLKNVLGYSAEPLVSVDFNHNPASCTFDATQTTIENGQLVKVMAWYDNEWGFSNRMLETAMAMAACEA